MSDLIEREENAGFEIGTLVQVKRGSCANRLGTINEIDAPDEDNPTFQFHVFTDKGTVYLEREDFILA